MPNTTVTNLVCEVRHIRRNILKVNISLNFSEPVYDFWLHSVFNFRFNRMIYQKFPIDLWVLKSHLLCIFIFVLNNNCLQENICGWMNHSTKSYIMDWTFGKVLQFSNLNRPCPLVYLYLKFENISMSHFPIPQFLPSGQFRVDHYITGGNRKDVWVVMQSFMSISDTRVEQFWWNLVGRKLIFHKSLDC